MKMKNLFSKILILTALSCFVVISGCKKDDDSNVNQVTINSKSYSLDKGYQANTDTIELIGRESTYEFDIYLLSSEISYNTELSNYSGSGNFIFLRMYSMNAEYLTPGMYTLDRFSSKDSLTFDYGLIGVDTTVSVSSNKKVFRFNMGIVVVNKVGNTYNIEFEYYLDDNKQVKGSYSGPINKYPEYIPVVPVGVGNLNLQSKDYPLKYGFIDFVDSTYVSPKSYKFDLYLVSKEITWDRLKGELTGTGNMVGMSIFSNYKDSLKTGVYNYSKVETYKPFTFSLAAVGINYNFNSESTLGLKFIKSGTINVSRSKSSYNIVYNMLTTDNKQVTGYFTGALDKHK